MNLVTSAHEATSPKVESKGFEERFRGIFHGSSLVFRATFVMRRLPLVYNAGDAAPEHDVWTRIIERRPLGPMSLVRPMPLVWLSGGAP